MSDPEYEQHQDIEKTKCRATSCGKIFSTKSNRDRHEKSTGHTPPPRREARQVPRFDAELSKYCCPLPNCAVKSEYKSCITRHIKAGCKTLSKRKTVDNKMCPHCEASFAQKSNRDRHVKRYHPSAEVVPEDNDVQVPTLDDHVAQVMNVSFVSENGSVLEQSMTMVDDTNHEAPIYEVFEPEIDDNDRDTLVYEAFEPAMNSSFAEERMMTDGQDTPSASVNQVQLSQNPVNSSLYDQTAVHSTNDTGANNLIDVLKELEDRVQQRDTDYEVLFQTKVLNKLKRDIKCRWSKHSAAQYLILAFDDALIDYNFVRWLAKKLELKPCRLQEILKNCRKDFVPRHSFSSTSHQKIYDYWLKDENSIISNDRRNGRDQVRMPEAAYLSKYGKFTDPNIEKEEVILKKKNTAKQYIKAPRRIYTKSLKRMHLDYVAENPDESCSRSTFVKYRPFYIEVPTEREKQSCLCITCQNMHTQLRGINTFRKLEKLHSIDSVTEYLKAQKDSDATSYPERTSTKSVNYHVFESVLESYVKLGVTNTYTRTTRVDKNKPVSELYEDFVGDGERYLYHRSIVDNIKTTLPKIREHFNGTYIEMDFSQNIALKPKDEVQPAHFSGKQQSLHCSIVVDEFGKLTYVYHLSDDTGHDAVFVNEVLEDIFKRWNIRDTTILLKSDNAGSQYKDRYAFALYQQLANKYNVRIIRVYGAAGHGKGLIDAMSSFGVKSILREDIVTMNRWYGNSEKMCEYLREVQPQRTSGEREMIYQDIDPKILDRKRMEKKEHPIAGCMKQHLFEYKPGCSTILYREYLCDCVECLQFNFEKCVKFVESAKQAKPAKSASQPIQPSNSATISYEDECNLDLDEADEGRKAFEFVTVPSFVALVSGDSNEPVYILKVEEKGEATNEKSDEYGHKVVPGDLYLRGNYLKMVRSRSSKLCKFSVIPGDVLVLAGEVFDVFVDIADDLTLEKEVFRELVSRATV